MIQRIQSVYLFLTTLFSLLFLKGEFLSFINKSGIALSAGIYGIMGESAMKAAKPVESILPLSLSLIIIPLLSFGIIFIYNKRKIQLLLVQMLIGIIILSIILSGIYTFNIQSAYGVALVPGFRMFIPVIQLILSYLAYRGIRKDDNLVKSYDRLR
jgi:drug/metabolite transporter (DMT)-like permease